MGNIIQLTENELHKIVENAVKQILKEDDYGLINGDNVGNSGLQKAKVLNQIKNDLRSGKETSYSLPIDRNNVLMIYRISNIGNNVFKIETNHGEFKQAGVENTLNLIDNLQSKLINQKQI